MTLRLDFDKSIVADLFDEHAVSDILGKRLVIDSALEKETQKTITQANISYDKTKKTLSVSKDQSIEDCFALIKFSFHNSCDPTEKHSGSIYSSRNDDATLCETTDYKKRVTYGLVKLPKDSQHTFDFLTLGENFNLHFEATIDWVNGKLSARNSSWDGNDY